MARRNIKVVIPTNPEELIQLCENIIAKHNEDSAASPLNGLDMAAFEALTADSRTTQNELNQLRRDAETATETRDTMLGRRRDQRSTTPNTLLNYSTRVRDILFGIYRGTEQRLGDFGFEVNRNNSSATTATTEPEQPEEGDMGNDIETNP